MDHSYSLSTHLVLRYLTWGLRKAIDVISFINAINMISLAQQNFMQVPSQSSFDWRLGGLLLIG